MKKTVLATAIATSLIGLNAHAQQGTPSVDEMWKIIQQQAAEIERLKQQDAAQSQQIEATADAVDAATAGLPPVLEWAAKTSIGGYGEHHFNHYMNAEGTDKVDAHRFVLFIGHQFSDTVRFFSEFELEHGIAGEGQTGEVELEQAYIEWDFAQQHSAVLGQFLIPVGIMNETHEPDTFYGTERNPVESNIVPATWWETGAMLKGELAPGLRYNAAIHSGLKTTDGGTIRSGRQKSANATAEDLAFTGRLVYTGVQGLELGATVQYQQEVTQGLAADDADAMLIEAHARYQNGPVTITALWAGWDIDGAGFEAAGRDKQEGWYIESSYKLTPQLGVFFRQNVWDNNAGNSLDTEIQQTDVGLNYWLTERVVLKADYSDLDSGKADTLNLGVGWSF